MTWHMDDMQNQDNVQDALADWRSGLFDEQDAAIQRSSMRSGTERQAGAAAGTWR